VRTTKKIEFPEQHWEAPFPGFHHGWGSEASQRRFSGLYSSREKIYPRYLKDISQNAIYNADELLARLLKNTKTCRYSSF